MKTKKRQPSELIPCEICGKSVFKRGYKGHIRLLHGLNITETTKVIDSVTKVNKKNTQVKQTIEVIRVYNPVTSLEKCLKWLDGEDRDNCQKRIDQLKLQVKN